MSTDVPSRDDLVKRATGVAEVLRAHADWAEENRRLHDTAVEALSAAGMFRLRTPKRYGGYETDTRTLIDVASELARADGSASWSTAVYWIPGWMAALFPPPVQDEVFGSGEGRVCGTLSPTGTAVPAEGGVVVNGRWGFISGAWHSQWQEIVAVQLGPGEPAPVVALVPTSELTIVDDWHTAGLRGTGSVTTVAEEVFIPQERVMPLGAVMTGRPEADPIYRPPLLPVASASSVGTAIGLAKAARDVFLQRLPERKITYTHYTAQREAPLTHRQVAQASMKIDEAEFHAYRLADLVDAKCADASPWGLPERVQARADLGAACQLAQDAVDIFQTASGASSIYQNVAMQRIFRDIRTLTLHALMHPDTNTELYGRVLCGLGPNTDYL